MNNTTISKVLQGLVLVHLSFSVWSGKKKLRPEDLKGANLPPDKLASLGSKRIFDPDALKVFATLKRQAERACEEVGVRFLGGYAIPEEKLAPTTTISQTGLPKPASGRRSSPVPWNPPTVSQSVFRAVLPPSRWKRPEKQHRRHNLWNGRLADLRIN